MKIRPSLYHRFDLSSRDIEDLMAERGIEPRRIVTDKLRSFGVAHRELIDGLVILNSGHGGGNSRRVGAGLDQSLHNMRRQIQHRARQANEFS